MPKHRCSAEEIIHKLREVEVGLSTGQTVAEAVRQIGVTQQTYYRWRKPYGGVQVSQAKRLKDPHSFEGTVSRAMTCACILMVKLTQP